MDMFMNSHSRETLSRIEQNSSNMRKLILDGVNSTRKHFLVDGYFSSSLVDDYSTLGEHIKNNTRLTSLKVNIHESEALQRVCMAQTFFDGLRQNSSIKDLTLTSSINIVNGVVWRPILMAYWMNNNLIRLHIESIALNNGGAKVVAITLRRCTNLREIRLCGCDMTNEQLLPMVEAMRGCSLEVLDLSGNRIGDGGCRALATLLEDPNCNLQHLDVTNNEISVAGAIAIANSLANNTTLKRLVLVDRLYTLHKRVVKSFTRLLCNTPSINATFCSNHTLAGLSSGYDFYDSLMALHNLLTLNEGTNKSHVGIKKILQYHSVIDMSPLFQLDSEDELTSKLLPYVVSWFERARKAFGLNDHNWYDRAKKAVANAQTKRELRTRKLFAIYQFVQVMPILFIPVAHTKVGGKKRKREKTMQMIESYRAS